jgi:hypothetical protein
MTDITIDAQFNGPPDSGNGGYCCGLFAATLDPKPGTAIEVTLRSPPPLGQTLNSLHTDNGVNILYGEIPVATAQPAELHVDYPAPPSLDEVIDASKKFSGFKQHPYPSCFVCGTARHQGDGLCIYPGPVKDNSQVCAPWRPFAELADDQGMIRPEFIWSALDCPSYFGAFIGQHNTKALLGRQCLVIFDVPAPVEENYIVSAWPLGHEGRKYFGGTGLFNQAGDCLALARGTWIVLN